MRGVKLPYKKQALIYYICINYKDLTDNVKEKIDSICKDVSGDYYYNDLFYLITTGKSVRTVAMERHISETVLYELRGKFYESWGK